MTYNPDLSKLPLPKVIEEIDFETDLQRRKDKLIALDQALPEDQQIGIAEFINLESEPIVKLLEEASYETLIIKNRINEVYRSKLLYFATGADLDHVAEEYGVTRLDGEPDEDLRQRVRIANRGSSSAGPDDWWKRHAMGAHELVEDVSVERVPIGDDNSQRGFVRLAILAQTPDGIPSEEILTAVRDVVTSDHVRNTCAKVEVVAATSISFDVGAKVWLFDDAPPGTFDTLEQALRDEVAKDRRLGWDVTVSWLVAKLHQPGVYRVLLTEPTETIRASRMRTPVIGNVSLEYMGVDE